MKGQTAIVTGGSSRIGQAICRRLAHSGASVVVGYRSDEKSARALVEELADSDGAVTAHQIDVTDFAAVNETVAEVARTHGGVDVLVNNAASGDASAVAITEPAEWASVIETNLIGSFHCVRAVALHMLVAQSGSIVNITSIAALTGIPGLSSYCASKAGVIGMTRSLSREFAPHGVRVNAVAPGYVEDTGMIERIDEARLEELTARVALPRLARVDEIADAVRYLASDDASYVTGHTLVVDGGLVA